MTRPFKLTLFAVFAGTGFSALTLQVVWQRVISLHAGVDLFSITTVVSAFLTGLGLGSLLGGFLADRLGPRRSLLAFAASNAGIGVFAWFSIWLFYDVYRSAGSLIEGTLSAFAFNFVILLVPTTLMGLSLPLVARGLVQRISEAAPMVGRLYSVNTIGAGLGAATTGWLLLGNLGFLHTVRLAGTLNLVAAGLVLTLWRAAAGASPDGGADAAEAVDGATAAARRPWAWLGLYALTGAVALGLEILFFRVIDALMRTNSYSFGHLLSMYLLLFGAGAAIASRLVGRTTRPDRWFLGLQYAVGVTALSGLLLLIEAPGRLGLSGPFDAHLQTGGYTSGYQFGTADEILRLGTVNLAGPLLIMGIPVLAMGMSFPFMQALVTARVDSLGRRTGVLLFANILGNVTGTLLVGFVLVDRLGTSGTLRLLAGLLVLPGLAAARSAGARHRIWLGVAAVGLLGALVAAFPSNRNLWAYFHAAEAEPTFALSEDRACVNGLKKVGAEDLLFVNSASQNGYPFDDFHLLIGLVPALLHPAPDHALAVGLGIGATPYGMAADPRLARLDVVEICGGQLDIQRVLAGRNAKESATLLSDPRVRMKVGDGRKFLLRADEPLDVVTVDAIRPQSAFSGSLFSVEFYELVRSRLDAEGLMSEWAPTQRVLNSVAQAFPYVMSFTVPNYQGAQFFVAGQKPIRFDRPAVLARFESLDPERWFPPAQTESIRQFLTSFEPIVVRNGGPAAPVDDDHLNHDLRPRDEYFLNNPPLAPRSGGRSAPPSAGPDRIASCRRGRAPWWPCPGGPRRSVSRTSARGRGRRSGR